MNVTFLDVRLALALNRIVWRDIAKGDLHSAARRQLLAQRLIVGVSHAHH